LTEQPRAYVNALLNAAVIYEDRGRYPEAYECIRRVLRLYPNHTRARLFLKDVESCLSMVIDEAGEQRVDARARLLDTPLSEFELSVRTRNGLKKMNIRTVGELIRLTEAELSAYKNFGETSLAEIKALLSKRGLQLGLTPEEIEVPAAEQAAAPRPAVPPGQEAVLSRPVSELELSVRARRCLQRLNVQTLGDLVQYTEADLLATRNFGVTSLNEVRARLAEHGLQLAPKRAT
jgi:DNA-directed RNA polymerase subunit alpha